MKIAIVGAGIGGLSLALALHRRGLACDLYETVPEVREIGVGITLLPHAMRELAELGLQPQLEAAGIENLESVFFNRFGQFIYREPRGRHAGYELPEIGIGRGKLHRVLYEAVLQRLGARHVHLDHRCVGVQQDGGRRDPSLSQQQQRCAACARARRRGGGLRRRQLRRAPPVLSARKSSPSAASTPGAA